MKRFVCLLLSLILLCSAAGFASAAGKQENIGDGEVDALTKEAAPVLGLPDADALKDIVRQAVSEAMHDLPLAVQPGSASEETGGKVEITDEDFGVADDFMSALGC